MGKERKEEMNPSKCLICRHRQGSHCSHFDGVCADLKDDSKFNGCGISFIDTHWELEAKTRKALEAKEAKLRIANMKEKV